MHHHSTKQSRNIPPRCIICGWAVMPEFAFDVHDNGRQWAHPDCLAVTTSDYVGIPSRPIRRGQRVIHTCGDLLCCNPRHLEVRG